MESVADVSFESIPEGLTFTSEKEIILRNENKNNSFLNNLDCSFSKNIVKTLFRDNPRPKYE